MAREKLRARQSGSNLGLRFFDQRHTIVHPKDIKMESHPVLEEVVRHRRDAYRERRTTRIAQQLLSDQIDSLDHGERILRAQFFGGIGLKSVQSLCFRIRRKGARLEAVKFATVDCDEIPDEQEKRESLTLLRSLFEEMPNLRYLRCTDESIKCLPAMIQELTLSFDSREPRGSLVANHLATLSLHSVELTNFQNLAVAQVRLVLDAVQNTLSSLAIRFWNNDSNHFTQQVQVLADFVAQSEKLERFHMTCHYSLHVELGEDEKGNLLQTLFGSRSKLKEVALIGCSGIGVEEVFKEMQPSQSLQLVFLEVCIHEGEESIEGWNNFVACISRMSSLEELKLYITDKNPGNSRCVARLIMDAVKCLKSNLTLVECGFSFYGRYGEEDDYECFDGHIQIAQEGLSQLLDRNKKLKCLKTHEAQIIKSSSCINVFPYLVEKVASTRYPDPVFVALKQFVPLLTESLTRKRESETGAFRRKLRPRKGRHPE